MGIVVLRIPSAYPGALFWIVGELGVHQQLVICVLQTTAGKGRSHYESQQIAFTGETTVFQQRESSDA